MVVRVAVWAVVVSGEAGWVPLWRREGLIPAESTDGAMPSARRPALRDRSQRLVTLLGELLRGTSDEPIPATEYRTEYHGSMCSVGVETQ